MKLQVKAMLIAFGLFFVFGITILTYYQMNEKEKCNIKVGSSASKDKDAPMNKAESDEKNDEVETKPSESGELSVSTMNKEPAEGLNDTFYGPLELLMDTFDAEEQNDTFDEPNLKSDNDDSLLNEVENVQADAITLQELSSETDFVDPRIIPCNKILVRNKPLQEPFEVEVEGFDETLVFVANSRMGDAIVSFDVASKEFKDLSGKIIITEPSRRDITRHINQKISSDGKLIAFIKWDAFDYYETANIYLMDSHDGGNLRKLVHCHSSEAIAFGPDDESILYVDPCNHSLKKVLLADNSVEEVENFYRGDSKKNGIFKITFVNGFVYWHTEMARLRGYEIWRKNLLVDSAIPELVYKHENGLMERFLNRFTVSPNGRKLVVLEFNKMEKYFLGIYDIEENESDLIRSTDDAVDLPMIHGQAAPLLYAHWMNNMFWYTDRNGQEWLFAERWSGGLTDLVRCKADEFPELNFELVISDFTSNSGISLVPNTKKDVN